MKRILILQGFEAVTVTVTERKVRMNKRTVISAKQYLGQLQEFDEVINQNMERLQDMKLQATGSGAIDYSRDRVQTSPAGDALCKSVSSYVDFDAEINSEIDRFAEMKNQIIREIRGLHNVKYMRVLFKVYVQYKNLKLTASEMKMSYNYVLDVHKKALNAFENQYPERYYLIR
jgi:hypothetical protein